MFDKIDFGLEACRGKSNHGFACSNNGCRKCSFFGDDVNLCGVGIGMGTADSGNTVVVKLSLIHI